MTFNTLKYGQLHSMNSNQHLQPSNVHLYTYNALTSKHLTDAPNMHQYTVHLQHEASQKLLWALKPLKIQYLTN